MKLYYHYKNKAYKFLGVAKHSETLKDLVVYETLHENELATLWARPQEMFHEVIEHEGKTLPRFRPASLEILEFLDPSQTEIAAVASLCEKILGSWSEASFQQKQQTYKKFHLLFAKIEGQVAGFKLGYELHDDVFYSWLGGLLPEFRGLGLAADLMTTQHAWCRQQGYKSIQTKTQNHLREMLILNLKQGFNVIGTENSEKGLKILLEKTL